MSDSFTASFPIQRSFGALSGFAAALLLSCFACAPANEDDKDRCGSDTTSEQCRNGGGGGIEIAGTYDSDWGSIHEIDDEAWDDAAIVEFDNADRTAIILQPEDAPWNPGTYSKLAWTPGTDGVFWYCTASFGKETAEEAREGEAPDSSDPENGGCGDFPWDRLSPRDPIEVKGEWAGEFGDESISSRRWSFANITVFDNEARIAVLQNPDDAEYDPGLFSLVVWTPVVDDAFSYCYESFGQETADEALEAPSTADSSDLEGGCGGFSWTSLTRASAE